MNKKMRNLKKGKQPVLPVAGPSRLKQPPIPETKPSGIDNPKEKSKASGKIEFFKAKPKEIKELKKEEPAKKEAKRMFFTKAPSPAPSAASEKVELEPSTVTKLVILVFHCLILFSYFRGVSRGNHQWD